MWRRCGQVTGLARRGRWKLARLKWVSGLVPLVPLVPVPPVLALGRYQLLHRVHLLMPQQQPVSLLDTRRLLKPRREVPPTPQALPPPQRTGAPPLTLTAVRRPLQLSSVQACLLSTARQSPGLWIPPPPPPPLLPLLPIPTPPRLGPTTAPEAHRSPETPPTRVPAARCLANGRRL